jgi:hypothetical protein
MPKAPMNKNYLALSEEDQIRFSRENLHVSPVLITTGADNPTNEKLWLRGFVAD